MFDSDPRSNVSDSLHRLPVGPEKGGVLYWAAFHPEAVEAVVTVTEQTFAGVLRSVDASREVWRPWSPFADLALSCGAGARRPYFRHRHLFSSHADTEPPEPLVDEEFVYESAMLADSLLDCLASGLPGGVLLVRHAEFLKAEALHLTERLRENPSRGLLLLLCFEAPPSDLALFERLDTLGSLTWISPPPSSPVSSLLSVPASEEPSAEERRQLARWLCFQSLAGVKADDSALERMEALASIGGFEEGIEAGVALLRRLTAASESGPLVKLLIALARLYRQGGDPASAARCLTLGRRHAVNAGDEAALVRLDFLLFETSYRSLVYEDVYLGLEDRLTEQLTSLGWNNHLAYVLTKNSWIQTVGRTRSWDEAWALWKRGRGLVAESGNQRRLSVAFQTLGSLQALDGDLASALTSTRKAVRLSRILSNPLPAAKAENGLGFLYLLAGDYLRARKHYGRALDLLPETRDHQEYIGTLVNLGRLYLYNDQPDLALPMLTSSIRAMDGLGVADLPFHPRHHTSALLGICFLKLGKQAQAREILKRIQNEEQVLRYSSEHRACLDLLLAEADGNLERSDRLLDEVRNLLAGRRRDLRNLLTWILMERGRWRSNAGDEARAEAAWNEAEEILLPAPHCRFERRQLEMLRSAGQKRAPRLAKLTWDSPLIIRFAKQETALRALRGTVQDYDFLQTWHQRLLPGMPQVELFQEAVEMIRRHFPVDHVAILAGEEPEVLALARGSDPQLIEQVAQRLSRPGSPRLGSLEAVFSLRHSGQVHARILCVDTLPEPLFGANDSRVLELAADHLAVLLLSLRRAQELEDRSINLSRALDVLRDTQERLVRSENLAVLGNLSAGLAHELNTPLAAILSSSRTLQGLLSGPLVSLQDEADDWSDEDKRSFAVLVKRLVTREAALGPIDRTQRRALREVLAARNAPLPEAQADLWFEVGLGPDKDLQDSLGTSQGIVKVLERLVPVSQGHRLSRVIEEAATRAGSVVGTLRSYLQGDLQEESVLFSLAQELHSVLAVLGATRWRALTVVWDLPPDLEVRGRRLSLSQVWTNLVQNAVQAMEGKGILTLSARSLGTEVVVEVTDTGPGITEVNQDRILEPFFTTKKQSGGLGLGLDICRRIVESHQGKLSFESRPGRTVFRVTLPLTQR